MSKQFGSNITNRDGKRVELIGLEERRTEHHKDRRAEDSSSLTHSESDTVLTMKFLLGIGVKLENIEEKAKRIETHLSKIPEITESLADMKERMTKLENSVSLLRVDNLMMFLSNIDKSKGQELRQVGEGFVPKQEKKQESFNVENVSYPNVKEGSPDLRKADRRMP